MIGVVTFSMVLSGNAIVQDTVTKKTTLETRAYLDAYYSYDFSKPATHLKAPFLYNHNRHNEVNIYLAISSLA